MEAAISSRAQWYVPLCICMSFGGVQALATGIVIDDAPHLERDIKCSAYCMEHENYVIEDSNDLSNMLLAEVDAGVNTLTACTSELRKDGHAK